MSDWNRTGREDDYGRDERERRDVSGPDRWRTQGSTREPESRTFGDERSSRYGYGRQDERGGASGQGSYGAGRGYETYGRGGYGGGQGYGGQGYQSSGQGYGPGSGDLGYGRGQNYGSDYRGGRFDADRDRDEGRQFRGDDERRFGRWDDRRDEERSWAYRAGQRIGSMFGGDREGRGEHRGRGPKNYTRSDDRIREDVNDRLSDDEWLDASEIEVIVVAGEVTLSGTVRDRDDKRRAEDLAERVSGVKHVQNNIRLQQGSGRNAQGASSASANAGATTGASAGVTGQNPALSAQAEGQKGTGGR